MDLRRPTSCIALTLLVIIIGMMFHAPPVSASLMAKNQYLEGNRACRELMKQPKKLKYRENWLKCIDKYQRIFLKLPDDPWAAAAMYRSAELYLALFKHSYSPPDRQEAVDLLHRITRRYPRSAYREKALNQLVALKTPTTIRTPTASTRADVHKTEAPSPAKKSGLSHKTSQKRRTDIRTATPSPSHSMPKSTPSATTVLPTSGKDAVITDIRYWSNPSYTRVVVDMEKERPFVHALLEKNLTLNKPKRLFIDIEDAVLDKKLPRLTDINDHLLTRTRAGQHSPHSVRVVVDIKSFDNYKIFSLKDPFRVVLDVWAKKGGSPTESADADTNAGAQKTASINKNRALARQLALGVKTIVIDPGHGGKDPGALGYFKGVQEKKIVLDLARRLEKKIQKRLGCSTILTRTKDQYISLEGRAAMANTKSADLFISLHCNAAENRKLSGVETYFLNLATDDGAINVAARENATSKKNISDLESILNDLMKNAKINESSTLAREVQKSICSQLGKHYSNVRNLGVKQAPFYVLLGATMPSILIETSFLSNKIECKRLLQSRYQNRLCDSIVDGVEQYIKMTTPGSY